MFYINIDLQDIWKRTTHSFGLSDNSYIRIRHISENYLLKWIDMVSSLMNTGPPLWLSKLRYHRIMNIPFAGTK